ncbi:MAG: type II toxin-antitoxin system prevent-host-death family antitoxin, partial [Microbacteriaceae bacterium]|nr:type II toxin-antitoxin system prevent-host-death family antitoxin [Microbacteriaceae bacterium]
MRRWPVQDAKARLSEMILAAMKEGPQMITKRGED